MGMGWPYWIVLLRVLLLLPCVFSQTHVVNNLPDPLVFLCSSTIHHGLPMQGFTYHSLTGNGNTLNPCSAEQTAQPLCCTCRVKVLRSSLDTPHTHLSMLKTFSLFDSHSHFEVSNLIFTPDRLIANQKSQAPTAEPWADLNEVLVWPQGTEIWCSQQFSRDLENFMIIMRPMFVISDEPRSYTKIAIENLKEDLMDVTCANTHDMKKGETFRMMKGSTHELKLHTRPDIFHACHFRAVIKWKFSMVIFIYAYFEPFVGPLNYVGLMEDGLVYSGEYAKHEMQFLWKERPHNYVYPSSLRDELLTDTAKTFVRRVF